jgi:hypothetical protein
MQLSKSRQDVWLATLMLLLVFAIIAPASAQDTNQNAGSQQPAADSSSQQVPSIDGGLGPCSVEVTVKRPGGKVVEGAKITVHIAYGFLNVRRLDLEVPTNTDGKARITGLPNNLKHGLLLHGSKDNLLGTAFVDPAKTCEAKHELVLVQQAAPEQDNSAADQKDTENKDAGDKQTNDAPQ